MTHYIQNQMRLVRKRPALHGGNDDLISKPMDDEELRLSLPRGTKVVRYADLKRYRTIYDLLKKPRSAAIVLYEQEPKVGHWVAIARNEKGLFFFDPYGEKPDKQLEYSQFSRHRVMGAGDKSLSSLIATYKDPQNIHYNPVDYQKESPNVNTCGRHSVNFIRCAMAGGSLDDYYAQLRAEQQKTGLNPDQIVSERVPIDLPDDR